MTIKLTLYSHYINSLLFHMNLLLGKACFYHVFSGESVQIHIIEKCCLYKAK